MGQQEELVAKLARLPLFEGYKDKHAQLLAIARIFDEVSFPDGERVLRQGIGGSNFYVILDGEAAVWVDGIERNTLGRGDFFGEISILLGQAPVADIVAVRPLRCLVLGGEQVEGFLTTYPHVLYRMFLEQSRRLSEAVQWRS